MYSLIARLSRQNKTSALTTGRTLHCPRVPLPEDNSSLIAFSLHPSYFLPPIRNLNHRSGHCSRYNPLLVSVDSLTSFSPTANDPLGHLSVRSPPTSYLLLPPSNSSALSFSCLILL